MRNRGWCACNWPGSKSSILDTEARIRKFAERRILARPSLSRMLFPTRIVRKDCCLRIATLPTIRKLTMKNGAIEIQLLLNDMSAAKRRFFGRNFIIGIFSVGKKLCLRRSISSSNLKRPPLWFATILRMLDANSRSPYIPLVIGAGSVLRDVVHNSKRGYHHGLSRGIACFVIQAIDLWGIFSYNVTQSCSKLSLLHCDMTQQV